MGETLASKIRRARELRGWTQQRLADELGVARETVGNWETGVSTPRNKLPFDLVVVGITLMAVGGWRLATRVDRPVETTPGAVTVAAAGPPPPLDTPAGWYPNPDGPGRRYWTGSGWTKDTAP